MESLLSLTCTATTLGESDPRVSSAAGDPPADRALLEAAHDTDDEAERHRLGGRVVIANLDLARWIARRYRGRGIADDDLDQAAYEGLVKAVMGFDPARGDTLTAYAVPTIQGEVRRLFRDQGWSIRPPRRLQEQQWALRRHVDDLTAELGRHPTGAEICETSGLDGEEYRQTLASFGAFAPPSLDEPVHDGINLTLGESLASGSRSVPEIAEGRAVLSSALPGISDRDRRIVYLRFFEDLTLAEIGADIGVSQMQVSRLLSRILSDLRHQINGQTPPLG